MTDPLPGRDRPDPAATELQARLTPIPRTYTLPGTPERGSETDRLMVRKFLETLAEVALSVAFRKLKSKEEGP